MLSKSIFINLETLKPKTLSQGLLVKEILELTVCYQIQRHLNRLGYGHLPIAYNYSIYKINSSSFHELDYEKYGIDYSELSSINYILDKAIEKYLEEFNIHHHQYKTSILNFNSCLINKTNFILSVDLLEGGFYA